ncbi:rab GTPase-binding effector protein 1 isoform X1 [Harmonia axyridis]|uniref:rab GTPase-binding effector protein 1 isoform X1 n=1 Tax=Harmonia axyridis TaxID=115357 RepID=UPI001E27984C|nr:rab GTPase-binding effector protein 1 isoform X1 [Harmonia axyridis]
MEDPGGNSNEIDENVNNLRDKIHELEADKKRIRDEFNVQRAKMKELFLQKEKEFNETKQENIHLNDVIEKLKKELDEAKSQLLVTGLTLESDREIEKRRADEEIASLQKLVHETIEESSSSKSIHDAEIEYLKKLIQDYQSEISEMKRLQQQSPHHNIQEHSLAPSNVLNALTKGIVKKLGADSFSSQDSLDDSVKKQYEDPEVLRSLVEPLEDQIKALKEKLRNTDELLQKCRECGHNGGNAKVNGLETITTTSQTERGPSCDMCQNYEAQLVGEQKKYNILLGKTAAAEKAVERHKEELLKEIGFRKEMEEKWNEKREELKVQVAELTKNTERAEKDLKELRQFFDQRCTEFRTELIKLTEDREKMYKELQTLQMENDNLVGKYTIHSQELQSQAIDLPNTVQELHELILKNNQDLIIAKIGKENAEANVNSLQSNIIQLKEQIMNNHQEREIREIKLLEKIGILKEQIQHFEKETKNVNHDTISKLQEQINKLTISENKLMELNNELKSRVSSLQQELDTSETVQKDFVLLTQNLQVQLERIRDSDTQVRWQHEEDVDNCPSCHSSFNNTKKKQHCRHCGRIFCQQCLKKEIKSGPNNRVSIVCNVCHTLLDHNSAPYFSEAPPPT